MALVNCTECKHEVSDSAVTCPHCGYALAAPVSPAPKPAAKGFPVWGIVLIVAGVLALVSMLLLGIMGAVAIPKLLSAIEKSKVGAAAGDIGAFNSALALYQVDVQSKTFPTGSLNQLYYDNVPGWAGPYMATIVPDPWGNAYEYVSNGREYYIQSVHRSDYHRAETIRYVFSNGVTESLP